MRKLLVKHCRSRKRQIPSCIPEKLIQIPRAMPMLAILFGIVLDALGVAAFIATGATAPTALIPSVFGTIIFVAGIVAQVRPGARKHAMHVAALFGLVATLGGLGMGLPKVGALLSGAAERPAAIVIQIAMGLIALVFLALCVKSFIDARRAKPENNGS
jgi:hypothetical protein